MRMETQKKRVDLMKYSPVICFLALEVFALIAFSLGSSPLLFGILSTLLGIVLVIFSFREFKRDGLVRSIAFLIPFVVYIVLTMSSAFTRAHIAVGDFGVAEIVFVAFGLTAVAISGYSLSFHKAFNVSTLLTVIYSAIALLVFINLIINLVNFGPFYSIIYKDYYMYYGGKRSDVLVKDLAYALEGFKFIEVKMTHYTLYPILLLSSLVVLLNLKFKENKPKFIAYVGFSVLAVLSLIFVPSIEGLIYSLILLAIIGLIFLFKKSNISIKPFAIILYVILGLAFLVLLTMLFNNQGFAGNFKGFIANNAFLNKLFNGNKYALLYNLNLTDVLCSERFFGFYTNSTAYFYQPFAHLTDSILFDNFMTSGVLGVALLICTFVFGFNGFKNYKINDDKTFIEKSAMLAFVTIYIIYSMMCADGEYAIFHNVVRPTFMTAPFMLVVFMMAYVVSLSNAKKEVTINEI